MCELSDVLMCWLLSGAGTLAFVAAGCRRLLRTRPAQWLAGEDGAGYTISLVMILPLFVTLLALFVESSQLMLARLVLDHAAYSAARSAAVWQPIDSHWPNSGQRLSERCHLAAARTLAPLAICAIGRAELDESALPSAAAAQLLPAYAQATGRPVTDSDYLAQKFCNAYFATAVKATVVANPQHDPPSIAVTVTYFAPLLLPGTGRLLADSGTTAAKGPTEHARRTMCTVAVLPIESSQTTDDPHYSLGIRYGEP